MALFLTDEEIDDMENSFYDGTPGISRDDMCKFELHIIFSYERVLHDETGKIVEPVEIYANWLMESSAIIRDQYNASPYGTLVDFIYDCFTSHGWYYLRPKHCDKPGFYFRNDKLEQTYIDFCEEIAENDNDDEDEENETLDFLETIEKVLTSTF